MAELMTGYVFLITVLGAVIMSSIQTAVLQFLITRTGNFHTEARGTCPAYYGRIALVFTFALRHYAHYILDLQDV